MKKYLKNSTLATRLSIAFSLISCVVFLSVGLLSYYNMQKMLNQQRDQNLVARIERIAVFLKDQDSFQILVQHPNLYENMVGTEDNLLILKNNNHTLININPLKVDIPNLGGTRTIRFIDNKTKRATTRLAYKTVTFKHQTYQLIAGKQLDETQSILNQYLSKLIFYSLLGIVMASLLGRWIGVHMLKSLNELIAQTNQIKGTQLQPRLQIKTTNVEVEQLRSAMNGMLEKIQINYDQLARFSEDIAHELRTPLNNLMGQTQITLMHAHSQQELEQLLYSHLEEYERLSKMVDNMLFIARSESENYLIEKDVIDLQHLILGLVNYFEFLAEDKKMSFVLNLAENLSINGNADLFKRAISNLIVNAISYGREQQSIVISTKQIGDDALIEILTQGISIEQSHLNHLFERFYQIDSSRHMKAKTGGLGLAIVRSIMLLHDGEASVRNTQNGVIFCLRLKRI